MSRGSRRPREPAGGGATETGRGKWDGAGGGAELRGARAAKPAGAGAERYRPLWEIGMLSQSGGGAGDPRSPARPEAEPCRDLGWMDAAPQGSGASETQWNGRTGPVPSISTPRPLGGPLTRALPGQRIAMSGTKKEDVPVAGYGPWLPRRDGFPLFLRV